MHSQLEDQHKTEHRTDFLTLSRMLQNQLNVCCCSIDSLLVAVMIESPRLNISGIVILSGR